VTAAALVVALAASPASADAPVSPWWPAGSVPPSSSARSVVARSGSGGGEPGDMILLVDPDRAAARRGTTRAGTSLPFYGTRRGPGCNGEWWLVGPLAWVCSDQADLSPAYPVARSFEPSPADGLPTNYYFVKEDGTSAYASTAMIEEGTSDRELEAGSGIAAVEQRTLQGEPWVRTTKGLWLAVRDLAPARPSTFHGESIERGHLDFAWVRADRASYWPEATPKKKPGGSRLRFSVVRIHDDSGAMVHLDDGTWMLKQDLARPSVEAPPPQVALAGERWIDVELATQTLVAYEGSTPVFATLVSTGRAGDDATPRGVHRIWVKILSSDMGNTERSDGDARYSLQDVPYVQFFDGAVGLHGTYWHRDFGHARSHGCVNLAPLDARRLFDFTAPRVPAGWVAAYPVRFDEGTVVRVR
jgi:hypothetical protein